MRAIVLVLTCVLAACTPEQERPADCAALTDSREELKCSAGDVECCEPDDPTRSGDAGEDGGGASDSGPAPDCSVSTVVVNTRAVPMAFKVGLVDGATYATIFSSGVMDIGPGQTMELPKAELGCGVRTLSAARVNNADGTFFDNKGAWCEAGRQCHVTHTIADSGVTSVAD